VYVPIADVSVDEGTVDLGYVVSPLADSAIRLDEFICSQLQVDPHSRNPSIAPILEMPWSIRTPVYTQSIQGLLRRALLPEPLSDITKFS
jgi:hypothetical protein